MLSRIAIYFHLRDISFAAYRRRRRHCSADNFAADVAIGTRSLRFVSSMHIFYFMPLVGRPHADLSRCHFRYISFFASASLLLFLPSNILCLILASYTTITPLISNILILMPTRHGRRLRQLDTPTEEDISFIRVSLLRPSVGLHGHAWLPARFQ